MNEPNMADAMLMIRNDKLRSFWKNLKLGFQWFENNKAVPKVSVSSAGEYVYS